MDDSPPQGSHFIVEPGPEVDFPSNKAKSHRFHICNPSGFNLVGPFQLVPSLKRNPRADVKRSTPVHPGRLKAEWATTGHWTDESRNIEETGNGTAGREKRGQTIFILVVIGCSAGGSGRLKGQGDGSWFRKWAGNLSLYLFGIKLFIKLNTVFKRHADCTAVAVRLYTDGLLELLGHLTWWHTIVSINYLPMMHRVLT